MFALTGADVRSRQERVLRARRREKRDGTRELMILIERALLGTGVAEHEARDATIELAVEQLGGDRLVLRIDRHAGGREPATQLGAPRGRDGEVLRRRLELEGVLVERRDERLRLRRDVAR